jgi:solute carrier family 25 oxoglutarate transporter 11
VFGASAIAGFFASAFSLPFDYVKTQMQKMKPDPVTGQMPFKGPVDCALKQVAAGGPLKLWSGFPTYYVRIAPHAMITLIMQDNVKKMWKSMGL